MDREDLVALVRKLNGAAILTHNCMCCDQPKDLPKTVILNLYSEELTCVLVPICETCSRFIEHKEIDNKFLLEKAMNMIENNTQAHEIIM